jgi:DNA-binding transcriptional ArsR family regulator
LSACLRTLVPQLRTIVLFLRTIDLVFENSSLADLTVGRSTVRQRILALLMAESSGRLHLREIQRRAGTSPGTASRELARLVAAGLVDREAEGNQVYFRASTSPFAAALRALLVAMPAQESGPRPPHLPRSRNATPSTVATAPIGADELESGRARPPAPPAIEEAPAEAGQLPQSLGAGMGTSGGLAAGLGPGGEARPRLFRPRPAEPQPTIAGDQADVGIEPRPGTEGGLEPAAGGGAERARLAEPAAQPAPIASTSAAAAGPRVPRTPPDPLGIQIAGRFAEALRPLYGDRLRGVYLFGARAAGPAAPDADVETIVVLDKVDGYGAELERTSQVCAGLSHELDIVVSRVFWPEADWDAGPDGVLPDVRTGAVLV